MNKKIVNGLMVVFLVALAAASLGQFPRLGSPRYSLPANQPMAIDLRNPPSYYDSFGAVGGYRIPVALVNIIIDGEGLEFSLHPSSPSAAWYDSLHIHSMGEADSLRVYGR